LAEALIETLESDWSLRGDSLFHRLEIKVPSVNLISILSQQTLSPKLYWADRDSPFKIAALGAVLELKGLNDQNLSDDLHKIKSILPENDSRFRFYGGASVFACSG